MIEEENRRELEEKENALGVETVSQDYVDDTSDELQKSTVEEIENPDAIEDDAETPIS